MRADQQLIRADQRIMRSDLGRLLSDQHQLKADQVFIKQELVQGKADVQILKDDQKYVKKDLQEVKELLGQAKKGQVSLEKMLSPQGLIQQELVRGKADLKAIKNDQDYVKHYLQEVNQMLGQSKKGQERLEDMLDTLLVKLEPLVNHHKSFGRSCADADSKAFPKRSGIYDILIPRYSAQPFKIYCDAETLGGNWLTIMRREDGSVEFNRNWTDYKYGFGDIDREFFLGMDKIHALTQDQPQELLVMLEDNEGIVAYETYDAFGIGSESEQYKLHTLGSASGDAGDSLTYSRGMGLTTADRDNDNSDVNCAVFFSNPWWHKNCFETYLSIILY